MTLSATAFWQRGISKESSLSSGAQRVSSNAADEAWICPISCFELRLIPCCLVFLPVRDADDGQLMFGSSIEDLAMCEPTATMFPAGTMFSSVRHSMAFNPGPSVSDLGCCPQPSAVYSRI